MTDEHPKQLGPYRILDVLGEGGMAVVYLAEQTSPVKRRVALKIIKLGMDTKQVVARFESERQALAVLDHPNIAKVFDGGITDTGRSYFVMEQVHGIPITNYCDDNRLTTNERLRLFLDVCSAVQHAHHKGLIHRDLKPSNILVGVIDGRPHVKVIDFGIAKATGASFTERTMYTKIGQIIGTPQYMSPEQAEITGLDVDTRTDIYSLGVILYELLVGALPLDLSAFGERAIRLALIEKDPPKPSTRISELHDTREEVARARNTDVHELRRQLMGDLDWIVMRAIAKDRTRRYETPNALAMECQRFLNQEPVLARPPSPGYVLSRFVRRNRTMVTMSAIALLAVLAGATAATFGFIRASQAERVALREAESASQISLFLTELFRVADPSESRGNSITAREILDKGANRIRVELSSEPEIQAVLMNTIGNVYSNIGLYTSAQLLLRKALELAIQTWGAEEPEIAAILFNLAELERLQSNYENSESLHRKALSIREAKLPQELGNIADSLHGLGQALYFQGKYDEAGTYLERALQIYSAEFGDSSERVAQVYSSLGSLAHSTNRYEEAASYIEKALAIFRGAYGDVHPSIASNLNDLALVFDQVGRLPEAKAAYEQSIATFRMVYPGDHEFTAETQAHYAGLLGFLGDNAAAEENFREAISMLERTVGPEHMLTARVKDSFGVLLFKTGRYEEAESIIAESIAVHKALLGERHINTARALNNMAACLFLNGDYIRAEPYFRESLTIRQEILGDEHADVANSKNNLADLLNRLHRYQEALPLATSAAEAYAESFFHTHWRAAVARNILGASLAGLGQYERAEYEIVESLGIISETVKGTVYHRMALQRAVDLYDAWERPDERERFRKLQQCVESPESC